VIVPVQRDRTAAQRLPPHRRRSPLRYAERRKPPTVFLRRTNYGQMSPRVVNTEIICTESDVRWGFIRGIMMGFIRGITLEDHPLRPAKTQVTGPVGGSAGIPDSLGHKPEDTSGRAGWSASSPPCLPHFRFFSHLFHIPLSFFYYLILLPSFSLHLCSRRCRSHARWPARGRVADLRESAAGMAGILTVRTASYSPTMTAERSREKSLVNGRCFVLRAARRRVIIELSPGNRKPHRIPRPARAMSVERGPS